MSVISLKLFHYHALLYHAEKCILICILLEILLEPLLGVLITAQTDSGKAIYVIVIVKWFVCVFQSLEEMWTLL